MSGLVIQLVVFWIATTIGSVVASHLKNRPFYEGLLLGGLLGMLGFLIEITLPAGPPKAPPGTFAEQCDYCNAIQNVSLKKPEYECWQCGTTKKFRLAD